jgi:hypothetical protein
MAAASIAMTVASVPVLAPLYLAELMSGRTGAMVVVASYEDEHPLPDMSA